MVTKTFNSLNDDIKITTTILRSNENNSLILETSNNLIITSDNLTLNSDGDLSVNNINVNGQTLQSYIQNTAGTSENIITLNSDASLNNLDISNNLKVDGKIISSSLLLQGVSLEDLLGQVITSNSDPSLNSLNITTSLTVGGDLTVNGTLLQLIQLKLT